VALQEVTAVQVNDDDVELSVVVVLVVVVVLSFLAHDQTNAKMPTIKTIQNSNFFIITSFSIEECRIIPTFMYRVWC